MNTVHVHKKQLAYPCDITFDDGEGITQKHVSLGMTLRDYFAGQALSMLSYHNILIDANDDSECALQIQNAAVLSYRLADAMIAERDKEPAS